jgi:hypothetical protein
MTKRSVAAAFALAMALFLAGPAKALPHQQEPVMKSPDGPLDIGFRHMYELDFEAARAEFNLYERQHPEDPLGPTCEAASYLFEEFNRRGILTSAFFLNDDKLLNGVPGKSDESIHQPFLAAIGRARQLAGTIRKTNPKDPGALFAITLAAGMEADYDALIAKERLSAISNIKESEKYAAELLQVDPSKQDAYLALGAANYIVACMPAYKRAFLWMGGVHGDRQRGMDQLKQTAMYGNYLRPFAKVMLALAALREHQMDLARTLFGELTKEFPTNAVFAHEYELASNPPSKK